MIEITEKQDETFEERSRNAARIFVISFLTTTLIGIYYSFVLYQRQTPWGYGESNVQAFFIAFASLLGYWLLKQKQLLTSVFIYLGVFSVAIAVSVLHFGGMDFILALIILLMYIGVAGATLPRQIAEGTIVGSIFLSVVVGFLGYWDPLGREFFPPDIIAYIAATFLIVIYGTFLGRQFRRYSLRTKLILAFAILSAAGIGVAFSVASFNMERVLSANSRQRLLAQAESSANDIDAFLQYSSDAVETASSYLDLRAYLLLSPKERIGTQTERQVQNILYALKNRNPDILSYGLLDLNGINIIDSRTANIGKSEASLIYFDVVMSSGSTYISNVLYPPAEKGGVFFIGTPVYNDMGVMVGILRAKYDAALLQDMLNEEVGDIAGADAFFVLFDENNIVLAHQRLPELIGKMPMAPTGDELSTLLTNYFLPTGTKQEDVSFNLPILDSALDAASTESFFDADENNLNIPLTGAIISFNHTPWKMVALQSQDVFLSPVRQQSQIFFALAMGTIFFAIIMGYIVSGVLAAPILRLQTVAQRFSEGDLNATAIIEADDEVGNLAQTFNTLTTRLRETVLSLEERVQERTHDLELRSEYLESAAEVGRVATTFVDANELSRMVVDLIRERFGLYYVGLFLADKNNEWAMLKAGTGIAGEVMLANKHRLKIGEGMIGWTVKYGEARIALDVGADAVRFENPVLPETRSEGALPLRSRGRILGAISVQSKEPAAFTFEILTTLQTMADQIAVAFDNAALFATSEAALKAERRAYGELTLQSWHDVRKRNSSSAYRVEADGSIRTLDESAIEEKHQFIGAEQALREDGRVVVMPIKSRGHTIGGIRIMKDPNSSKWTKNQLQLVATISEQLSVALESARLFEDTQLRAQREAIISDISSKVGASIRMDAILKTTVQELGKALSGADISFEITGPEKGAKLKE